ncbi:unnamed protein product, partial [Staurois parvus]
MRGPGRADTVNAGSGESGYGECGAQGLSSDWGEGEAAQGDNQFRSMLIGEESRVTR